MDVLDASLPRLGGGAVCAVVSLSGLAAASAAAAGRCVAADHVLGAAAGATFSEYRRQCLSSSISVQLNS